jgi:putative DNA primase/helicase
MNTSEAMAGHEQMLLTHYQLPPITGGVHYKGECPLCSGKGKFRLHMHNGRLSYICVCGSGNLIGLICEVTGKAFKDVAAEIDRLIGNTFNSKPKPVIVDNFKEKFLTYSVLRGTQAQTYLNNRGIYEMPKRGIRYADGLNDPQGYLSGMVAVASDENNRACYEHRTYLKDGLKAQVDTQRKIKKLIDADISQIPTSVKLFNPSVCLGIAEGLETALSAHQLYKVPTWSSLNSGAMKKFRAPTGVKNLYIFADNDSNGTGLAAAFECGNRNILSKNDVEKVIVRWPSKVGDFNDVLNTETEVVEWILLK